MARLAWVTMTRVTADRQQPVTPEPRVDAGVKELNEMTIGRTDDPENPRVATARASRIHVWDWITDPIWASGHGTASTGRTHDRNRPARQTSRFFSCIQGAVHTCNKVPVRVGYRLARYEWANVYSLIETPQHRGMRCRRSE